MTNEQRLADCRRLYDKYNGKHHELIEREMRALGHKRFSRRILYTRRERGRTVPGWIARFGWSRSRGVEEKRSGGAERRGRSWRSRLRMPLRYNHGKARRMRSLQDKQGLPAVMRRPSGTDLIASSAPPLPNCSTGFADWLKYVSPYMNWDAAHHRHIIDTLERVTSGECRRLMIFMPPRHGKSELVTVRYAAWRLRQNPATNVIIGSYNQRLANRFSRKIKTVLCEDFALSQPEANLAADDTDNADRKDKTITRSGRSSLSVPSAGSAANSSSPFPFARPRLKNSESEWETRVGGGLRAVGVGSGVTGFGANLLIVDDPVKSRAEAESIKYRERVWDWFNDDLYTRLEPDGQIILIQTRWHEDDLAGRLLAENKSEWTIIDLPALAEPQPASGVMSPKGTQIIAQGKAEGRNPGEDARNDADPEGVADAGCVLAPLQGAYNVESVPGVPLPSVAHPRLLSLSPSGTGRLADATDRDVIGRSAGDALWPERFDVRHLENTKEKIGAYSFASLYQQHPVPAEGGMFKKEWFTNIFDRPPHGLIWKRGYDLAITANPTSDYTASYRVAYDKEGNLWIDGGFRRRIEYPEQRRYVLGRIREELDTEHGIEQSANGTPVYQEIRKEVRLQGRAFRAIQVKGDKATRAAAWLNLAAEGKLRLVRDAWNKEFIDECCAFPLGTHDDQIDAVSIAVAMHAKQRYRAYGF